MIQKSWCLLPNYLVSIPYEWQASGAWRKPCISSDQPESYKIDPVWFIVLTIFCKTELANIAPDDKREQEEGNQYPRRNHSYS